MRWCCCSKKSKESKVSTAIGELTVYETDMPAADQQQLTGNHEQVPEPPEPPRTPPPFRSTATPKFTDECTRITKHSTPHATKEMACM